LLVVNLENQTGQDSFAAMKKPSARVLKYLSEIGTKGGQVKSQKKADAVRQNGKKGGRPKGAKDKKPRKPPTRRKPIA
jgi:hypothetical protein